MNSQRYVSSELTHFVGKSLENDEARYNLLAKIMKSGWLTHPPHDPKQPISGDFVTTRMLTADGLAQRCIVCFCDIPEGDYSIHMSKYGMFGISFSKKFLVAKGANPVFYVANDSILAPGLQIGIYTADHNRERVEKASREHRWDRSLLFDASATLLLDLVACYGIMIDDSNIMNPTEGTEKFLKEMLTSILALDDERISRLRDLFRSNEQALVWLNSIKHFLFVYVLGFIKGFDSTLSDNDPNNFYMEREWRVLGNVQFTLDNIERVILPREYTQRFCQDFPNYIGQVSFTETN